MAQKAAKTLAASNTRRLNTTHYITLFLHTIFLLLRALLFRSSFTRRSVLLYILTCLPALGIEAWFERIARPRYGIAASAPGELKSAGEDLDAKGLTEWMWDVLYWSWGCLGLAAVGGDWAWWLYAAVPLYSVYLAYTAFAGARQSMAGLAGAGGQGSPGGQAPSKRQAKLEKRGGQRMQHR